MRLPADKRKTAILQTAVRLFAERGFRGTTTRDLAAAVGVTEPVLYQHFATKRDLYDAIIENKSHQGWARFHQRLDPYFSKSDDRGFFTALAEVIFAWHRNDPAYLRLLLFSGLEGHELCDLFYERHTRTFFVRLRDYIARRIREKAFRPIDPMLAARLFTGMIAHYCQQCAIFRRSRLRISQKQMVNSIVTVFLEGMKS
jgi:AcrR family transcriptional regulator